MELTKESMNHDGTTNDYMPDALPDNAQPWPTGEPPEYDGLNRERFIPGEAQEDLSQKQDPLAAPPFLDNDPAYGNTPCEPLTPVEEDSISGYKHSIAFNVSSLPLWLNWRNETYRPCSWSTGMM